MSGNTIGDEDFQPQLAERWEWNGPVTLVFHLDPRARWQDGRVVTAGDVVFTYDAYTDSLVNSPFRSSLRLISAVTARDSLTAVFRFRQRYPEMFYDAVYQMRILPAHLLRTIPRDQWRSAPFGRAPVGDGPYRFVAWKAGESLELAADSTFYLGRPHIRRVIVRFTPNLGGDHAARRRRGGCDRTARLARQREARVRGPPARVLSLQGGPVRLPRLQPRNARRLDQAPSPVRRPRATPRARHGRGPPPPAAHRVRRFRQGPARPDLAARLDLGPRDTRAAARQRAGGPAAHAARLDRLGLGRRARPRRPEARVPHPRPHDEREPSPVRPPVAGDLPHHRRRRPARRGGSRSVQRAGPNGTVRRGALHLEHGSHALVQHPADMDAGGAGAGQPRALREPRRRPPGGPRRGGDETRRGTASLADRQRGPEPGRPRGLPVRAPCRGGSAPPDHGPHEPPRPRA